MNAAFVELEDTFIFLDGFFQGDTFGIVVGGAFFDKDVLGGAAGIDGDFGVPVVGGKDHNAVDVGIVEDFAVVVVIFNVGREHFGSVFEGVLVDIADGAYLLGFKRFDKFLIFSAITSGAVLAGDGAEAGGIRSGLGVSMTQGTHHLPGADAKADDADADGFIGRGGT